METTDRLRIGLAGAGLWGTNLAEAVDAHDRAVLVALTDIDGTVRETTGERFTVSPGARYDDYMAMLRGETLDAVVIATPQGLHYDQIVAAFDHDLHVLCEKPLVTTVADARDLVERDDGRDGVLMVGYQRHLFPAVRRLRTRWQGDRTPTVVTGEITQDWTHHFDAGTNWRLDPDLSGGGHLFNVGTHVLDAILWTTGLTPTDVMARMTFYDDAQRIDKRASLCIAFENGTIATITDTGLAARNHEHVHAWDGGGAVSLSAVDWEPPTLRLNDPDGKERTPSLDAAFPNKVEAFIESIEQETPPPATARDGLRATAVLEAAYESARHGERVEVPL